jgi:uncharacterized damage-inducible protein DinB
MKRFFLSLLIVALMPAGQLAAQDHMHADADTHEHMQDHDAAVKSLAPLYEMVKGYITAAAEQMPEEKYSFRPTEEVFTFGEIVGHAANAMYFFCGTVKGTSTQAPANYQEMTSKADIVEGLKGSFANCDGAYAVNDAAAMEEVEFFGQTGTKLWVLGFNLAHSWEHYGNLVTYLRLNGMVPPSSQGGM